MYLCTICSADVKSGSRRSAMTAEISGSIGSVRLLSKLVVMLMIAKKIKVPKYVFLCFHELGLHTCQCTGVVKMSDNSYKWGLFRMQCIVYCLNDANMKDIKLN